MTEVCPVLKDIAAQQEAQNKSLSVRMVSTCIWCTTHYRWSIAAKHFLVQLQKFWNTAHPNNRPNWKLFSVESKN